MRTSFGFGKGQWLPIRIPERIRNQLSLQGHFRGWQLGERDSFNPVTWICTYSPVPLLVSCCANSPCLPWAGVPLMGAAPHLPSGGGRLLHPSETVAAAPAWGKASTRAQPRSVSSEWLIFIYKMEWPYFIDDKGTQCALWAAIRFWLREAKAARTITAKEQWSWVGPPGTSRIKVVCLRF